MKRILTLLAATLMVFGSMSTASALEINASGQFHAVFGFSDNAAYDKDVKEDNFYARSRIRPTFEFKASENLKGVWQFQVGNWDWGNGANMSANMDDFKTRLAYLSFTVPQTMVTVNMGIQSIAVPSAAVGTALLNDRMAGVTVNAAVADGIGLTALWARPYNQGTTDYSHNSSDIFGVIAGLDLGVANVSPYVVYARVGQDSGANALYRWAVGDGESFSHWYAGGAAIEINLMEALALKLDAQYATVKNDADNGFETDGFMVAFAADYALPFGTPGVFAWYSSGADEKGEGYMPVLGNDGGFGPTRYITDGSASLGDGGMMTTTGVGSMGFGAQVADMSFIEKLSHTFRVAYMVGTNDKESTTRFGYAQWDSFTGINEEISGIEIDFDTTFEIMENLTSILEMSYVIPDSGDFKGADDNMFNAQVYFLYNF